MFYELNLNGLKVEKQKSLPLVYKDIKLDVGYRLDLLVENQVVVEIKAVENLNFGLIADEFMLNMYPPSASTI